VEGSEPRGLIQVLDADTSDFVPWRGEWALPRSFKVWIEAEENPDYGVTLEVAPRAGSPVAKNVSVTAKTGGVTTEGLRSIPLARYVDMACASAAWKREEGEDGTITYRPPEPVVGFSSHHTRPSKGRRLSDEHLREVAQVYADALKARSRAPRKAVVDHWRQAHGEVVADQTVATWIQKARDPERGFLPPTNQRKAKA
jgi:hypothetical protein